MQDREFIRDYLQENYEEVKPMDFYREIFQHDLQEKGIQVTGKYNALAVELLPGNNNVNARKYIVTDDMKVIEEELLPSENFIIMSPISYVGKSRQSKNARFIYAIAIDLDGIESQLNLDNLFYQIEMRHLPKPTYTVWSGSGLHLYYQLEKAVPCFDNIVKQLSKLKKDLTRRIWNGYVSELADKPQLESLFQGFRIVGNITKSKKNRTKAFRSGDKVTIEYLNSFVPDGSKVTEYTYKSNLLLKDAKEKYPEWYERRIINKQPKGTWTANKAVYDWWLNKLTNEITVGHRYYGIMCLSIYAKKCGVEYDILEKDAYNLIEYMERLTVEDNNHFTREDVLSALEIYNDSYITFPIDSISKLTSIHIEKNKRNHRKQSIHLKIARATKQILKETGQLKTEGRPSKKDTVLQWRKDHKQGTIKECIEETNLSKSTVYKYWKDIENYE